MVFPHEESRFIRDTGSMMCSIHRTHTSKCSRSSVRRTAATSYSGSMRGPVYLLPLGACVRGILDRWRRAQLSQMFDYVCALFERPLISPPNEKWSEGCQQVYYHSLKTISEQFLVLTHTRTIHSHDTFFERPPCWRLRHDLNVLECAALSRNEVFR